MKLAAARKETERLEGQRTACQLHFFKAKTKESVGILLRLPSGFADIQDWNPSCY